MNFQYSLAFLLVLSPAVSYSETLCGGQQPTVYVSKGIVVGSKLDGKEYQGTLSGTKEKDIILGTDESDVIYGFGADDIICGGGGIDFIFGGEGSDSLFGEAGSDSLFGEEGDDKLEGGEGLNRVDGGAGKDDCTGAFVADCEQGQANSNISDPGLINGPDSALAYVFLDKRLKTKPGPKKMLKDSPKIFAGIIAGVIRETSTVSEVNKVLLAHKAEIIISEPGRTFVTIRIPEQKIKEELLSLIESMGKTRAFSSVIYQTAGTRLL